MSKSYPNGIKGSRRGRGAGAERLGAAELTAVGHVLCILQLEVRNVGFEFRTGN